MRPYPRILLGLAALASVLAVTCEAGAFCRSTTCKGGECPRDDNGCKTTGKLLYWPTSCVGFSVQKDGTELIAMKYIEQVVHTSFASWTDLPCDAGTATISFRELPQVSCHRTEYNAGGANANIIMFQDTKWSYTDVTNTLAKTTVTFDDQTGEILDADIEVNHAYNDITVSDEVVKYDLQSILTHEIGHFIGLDHSADETATMFASYDPGTTDLRSLEADDIAAACDAYPPDRAAKCVSTPHGGLADVCGGAPVNAAKGCAVGSSDSQEGGSDISAISTCVALLGVAGFLVRRRNARTGLPARTAARDRNARKLGRRAEDG